MIINSNIVGIIADDLTGANDTALQFQLNGADTNILLDKHIEKSKLHRLRLGQSQQNQEMFRKKKLLKK